MNATELLEKNIPQKIVAFVAGWAYVITLTVWFSFGHMDLPVTKTRFPSGFADCTTGGPINAYGVAGTEEYDAYSSTRLFFILFSALILITMVVPLIGQDSAFLNEIAMMIIVVAIVIIILFLVAIAIFWGPAYNREGNSNFVGNPLNSLLACCNPLIAGNVANRCPNGAPNYSPFVACSAPNAAILLEELKMSEIGILLIIVCIILLLLLVVLFFSAFLSKETTFSSTLQKTLLGQLNIGSVINNKNGMGKKK